MLCVGSFNRPELDPSALFLSTIAARGKGKVHIVDVFSRSVADNLARRRLRRQLTHGEQKFRKHLHSLPTSGVGDPFQYQAAVRKLQKQGMLVKTPAIHLQDARETKFRDKRFDVLVDSRTAKWICNSDSSPPEETLRNLMLLAAEYRRISNKSVLFIHHKDHKLNEKMIVDVFSKLGARVTAHEISGVYSLRNLDYVGQNELRRYAPNLFSTGKFGENKLKLTFNPEKKSSTLLPYYEYDRAIVAHWPENKKSEK